MVKKKGDLSLTVVQLPALYPTLDIISQISPVSPGNTPVSPGNTVCLNIAPQPSSNSLLKQVDVFEQCVLKKQALSSAVPDNTNTVIINNLSFWILYCGLQRVYKELLQLSEQYKVISSIIHDTLDPETEDTILLLPDIILSLSPSPDGPLFGTYLEVVRQRTGRTEKKKQHYTLLRCESGYKLDISTIQQPHVAVPENTPCDVTFELGLSSREKSARAATELPYTAAASQSAAADNNRETEDRQAAGEIHYIPDEEDDWDDEDPDDDLDI